VNRNFELGSMVEWDHKTKHGKIVCIVPSAVNPFLAKGNEYIFPNGIRVPRTWVKWGGGAMRGERSYIVEILPKNGKHPLYYWPRVNSLRLMVDAGRCSSEEKLKWLNDNRGL